MPTIKKTNSWKKIKPDFYDVEKWKSKKGKIVKILESKRYWKDLGYGFETEWEMPEQFVRHKFKKKLDAQKLIKKFMRDNR